MSSENHLVKGNGVWNVFPWKTGGGGVVAVFQSDYTGKAEPNMHKITGHKGAILDMEFSPFDDYLLATAAEDKYVRLWKIPEEGLTEDMTSPITVLSGHMGKLMQCRFHPSANLTMATADFKNAVKVWDIQKAKEIFSIPNPHKPFSLEWNYEGNLLTTIGSDKKLKIIDPRSSSFVGEATTHEGGKPQKVCFVKDGLFTTGFTKRGEKQFGMWDMKKLDAPLKMAKIDENSGICTPVYDQSSNTIFLLGKGDPFVKFYDILDQEPFIEYLSAYKSNVCQMGCSFIPKRSVDTSKNEIMRLTKLTQHTLETISFVLPRKEAGFQAELYMGIPSAVPALKCEEWASGETKPPVTVDLTMEDAGAQAKQEVEFEKSSPRSPKKKTEDEKAVQKLAEMKDQFKKVQDENQTLQETVAQLQSKVAYLEEIVQKHQAEEENMQGEILNLRKLLEEAKQLSPSQATEAAVVDEIPIEVNEKKEKKEEKEERSEPRRRTGRGAQRKASKRKKE
eukprot:TRINITY_DN40044_c0_g1_i1.p1 TRINITY_DN40044_c0_g1~~TRINITY_DN40044_c0_g1_i1.p1  ORF type:complete len:538 (-),score=110.48 TRINITY_DN40044_c0_g1_i1:3-1520(-)